jgi:hypothetical protein
LTWGAHPIADSPRPRCSARRPGRRRHQPKKENTPTMPATIVATTANIADRASFPRRRQPAARVSNSTRSNAMLNHLAGLKNPHSGRSPASAALRPFTKTVKKITISTSSHAKKLATGRHKRTSQCAIP